MRLLQPSSMVQISKKTPERFLKRALKIVRTGFGQPSIFNTDAIIQEMIRQGKSLEDARSGGASGCVESGIFGKENYNLTGYFNLPKVLEIALNNGLDPRIGKRIGIETGDPRTFSSFEDLIEAFRRQVNHFVDIKIRGNNIIERIYADYLPTPFLSLLIDDCIAKGKDYHDGGARYNTSYIQGVGIGTITDSLTSIKHNVFDTGALSFGDLLDALMDDFEGREVLRQKLLNKTPKYGNDDDYPHTVMRIVNFILMVGIEKQMRVQHIRIRHSFVLEAGRESMMTFHHYWGPGGRCSIRKRVISMRRCTGVSLPSLRPWSRLGYAM